MKNNYCSRIVILSTVISVVIMLRYNVYTNKVNQYEQGEAYKSSLAQGQNTTNSINNKTVDKESQSTSQSTSYTKEYLGEDYLPQKKNSGNIKNKGDDISSALDVNSSNVDIGEASKTKYIYNDLYGPQKSDSVENYKYDNSEKEQSVFKVATGEIEENLTTSDKIKLLYISFKLGKEDYDKVQYYLYAEDAEGGVLKALKLLKQNLSEKEYEKVRNIAGRFIDMDAAERLD